MANLDELTGVPLRVERIKRCAADGHDGYKRCPGCKEDREWLAERGLTKSGEPRYARTR